MRAVNPVLRRELVERWRSRRAVVTLTAYLAVLAAVGYLLYRAGSAILTSELAFGGGDASSAGPVLGRFLVEGLLFFVLLLVLFVAPGYAASQVSGERERRTLTLLQVTLLRPGQIALGKLGASVAWLTLLVVAALPLGAAAFFLGGIGIADLLRGVVAVLVVGVCVAAVALGISSMTRRTTAAIVLTYGTVLALVLGTLFVSAVEAVIRGTRGENIRTPVALYLNPFFGLADAVHAARPSGFAFAGLPSPLGIIAEALPGAPFVSTEQGGFDDAVAPLVPADPGFDAPQDGRRPVWLIVLGVYVLLGAAGMAVATRRLAVTEPRGRAVATSRPKRGPQGAVAAGAGAAAGGAGVAEAAAGPAAPGEAGWERAR